MKLPGPPTFLTGEKIKKKRGRVVGSLEA